MMRPPGTAIAIMKLPKPIAIFFILSPPFSLFLAKEYQNNMNCLRRDYEAL
jgi:hypothetical protein